MTDATESLERWRFAPAAGDWDDVLRRAGRRRTPGVVARRLALAVAAALLLAVPAFAIVGALGGADLPPGLRLSARFADGTRLELSAPRTVLVARTGGRVTPITFGRLPRAGQRPTGRVTPAMRTSFAWRLRADDEVRAVELRGREGKLLARLCAPCATGAGGTVRLPRNLATAAFNGATASLVLDDRTLHAPLVREGKP